MKKKKIPNSIFSRYGNAKALEKHGRTKKMRNKWKKEAEKIERNYSNIDSEYSKWSQWFAKIVSKFKRD